MHTHPHENCLLSVQLCFLYNFAFECHARTTAAGMTIENESKATNDKHQS